MIVAPISVEPWWGHYLPYIMTALSAFFSWRAVVAGKAAAASSAEHHASDQAEHAKVLTVCENIRANMNGNGNGKVQD